MIEHPVFQKKYYNMGISLEIRKVIEFLGFGEFHGHIEEVQFLDNS